MKFIYQYRTSDNVEHTGVVAASDREAAFQQLRSQGIRPGRMTEAPGVFNKLFGKGKRWIAISVLGALCLALGAAVLVFRAENTSLQSSLSTINSSLDATTRRQVIGDAFVIEKGIMSGWEDVFEHEGERFLASFAIPGVPAGLRNTNEDEVRKALDRRIEPQDGDSLEAKQIKSIVQGMKDELRRFLAKKGTVVEYGQRLVARQEEEIGYYQRAKREIEMAAKSRMPRKELEALWEKRNDELRALGIKSVVFPE